MLDSSVLLCLLNDEPGAARVVVALPSAVIGAVDLSEVVTTLRERGLSADEVEDMLSGLHLDVRPLTAAQATATGHLRPARRAYGLSLRDRACLALAAELGAVVLTNDQARAEAEVGVEVEVIR